MTTERNEAMVEIHTLRHRRQELVGELVRVDAHIAALGATPDRRTLIERILTASQTVGLSTTEHTRALGLHEYYSRELDCLHSAGTITLTDNGKWTVPERLPTARTVAAQPSPKTEAQTPVCTGHEGAAR